MRKLSYVLIIILIFSIVSLSPIHSQPNPCVNPDAIISQEARAQFEVWLNEPNGLNERFIDRTETIHERGQRLFYELILNNALVCRSDITQEMINSIDHIIFSYDNAIDHIYKVEEFQISRSQMRDLFIRFRNPLILVNNNIFVEALQFSRPDFDLSDVGIFTDTSGSDCTDVGIDCFDEINEIIRNDFDYIESDSDPPLIDTIRFNYTNLTDPGVDIGHYLNWTFSKDLAGGQQIDHIWTLTSSFSGSSCGFFPFISRIQTDVSESFSQDDYELTTAEALTLDSTGDYSTICNNWSGEGIGGGAIRKARHSWGQFVVPGGDNVQPQISNPTLWGLFNSTDMTYGILSFDQRDKIYEDMQVRLNFTITDADGRNNITALHANFNGTLFTMSFFNDSGTFVFNTTTPLIVENLEGETQNITDGYNVTFIFSLSQALDNGFYSLTNANVTDGNTNSTLSRVSWFTFIRKG